MVLEKVKVIISDQFDIDEEDIKQDTSFKDDLNADSLDLVELIMALEDEFDLEVEDDEVDSIKTVGDAVNHIKGVLGED